MKIDILTLFPQMFNGVINSSIIGRAVDSNLISVNCIDIRDFSTDKHRRVDDYPFGGGPGMVMMAEPIYKSIKSIRNEATKVIYLSPKGKVYNQSIANRLSKEKHLALLCGHYEGIDNRITENYIDEEISIGDYILTGGELAAMVIIDSVIRLIPGVLGKEESFIEESHSEGLLEYPQYTRPRVFNDYPVPEILLSGNHKKIEEWRRYQSLKLTYINRPDLFDNNNLSKDDIKILDQIRKELNIEK